MKSIDIAQISRQLNLIHDGEAWSNSTKCDQLPQAKTIHHMIKLLQRILFPNINHSEQFLVYQELEQVNEILEEQIFRSLRFSTGKSKIDEEQLRAKAKVETVNYIGQLPDILEKLLKDLEAMYHGDPAAESIEEIILSYLSFEAIMIYRLAHPLYLQGISIIPRIMSEYAHRITGIDIHPGAHIGDYFFIDHGTGIVIGETVKIGNNVKIYQGVTLGALSLEEGRSLKDVKRHPTIGDNVIIYANATILGGNTKIGVGSVIGGGVFITKSVEDNMQVFLDSSQLPMITNNKD